MEEKNQFKSEKLFRLMSLIFGCKRIYLCECGLSSVCGWTQMAEYAITLNAFFLTIFITSMRHGTVAKSHLYSCFMRSNVTPVHFFFARYILESSDMLGDNISEIKTKHDDVSVSVLFRSFPLKLMSSPTNTRIDFASVVNSNESRVRV